MKTLSVQHMPNGFEIETPTFTYWLKAGAAFTIGAGIVATAAGLFYTLFVLPVILRAMLSVYR